MKKIAVLTLTLIMCFNLCACENDEKSDNKKDDDKRVSQSELNRKRNLAEELERKFREKGGK